MSGIGSGHGFVLLMRHGRDLGGRGGDDVRQVGDRLKETIEGLQISERPDGTIKLGAVLHAPSPAATQTAALLVSRLDMKLTPSVTPELDPSRASTYTPDHAYESELTRAADKVAEGLGQARQEDGNAVLVIGHQPALSRIAATFSRTPATLAHSEIICFAASGPDLPRIDSRSFSTARAARGRWRIAWAIAPSDSETDTALRTKLTSKMQVSGVLAAVAVAALVFVLPSLFTEPGPRTEPVLVLRYVAALLLFLSAVLYLAALFYIDQLMMPPRFWREARRKRARPGGRLRTPKRPPTSATRVVHHEMTRIWSWYFTPASVMWLLAVALLGVSLFKPLTWSSMVLPGSSIAAGGALLYLFVRLGRPRLGVDD